MLIGRTPEEVVTLKERVKQLSKAGLRAEYLSSKDLLLKEPALVVGEDSGAAFLPDDCQLDATRTVAYLEKVLFIYLYNMVSEIYCLNLLSYLNV